MTWRCMVFWGRGGQERTQPVCMHSSGSSCQLRYGACLHCTELVYALDTHVASAPPPKCPCSLRAALCCSFKECTTVVHAGLQLSDALVIEAAKQRKNDLDDFVRGLLKAHQKDKKQPDPAPQQVGLTPGAFSALTDNYFRPRKVRCISSSTSRAELAAGAYVGDPTPRQLFCTP